MMVGRGFPCARHLMVLGIPIVIVKFFGEDLITGAIKKKLKKIKNEKTEHKTHIISPTRFSCMDENPFRASNCTHTIENQKSWKDCKEPMQNVARMTKRIQAN